MMLMKKTLMITSGSGNEQPLINKKDSKNKYLLTFNFRN